jgi:single-strand DNA-binding protein
MSLYINAVTLVGNLTKEIELKATPNGNKVATFSIATNRVWKNEAGEKQEEVEYHNIVVWGKTAETCAKYLTKGQQVAIQGRLSTRSWADKTTGEKKYRTEIIAESVQFGNRPNGAGVPKEEGVRPTVQPQGYQGELSKQETDSIDYGDTTISADDIPF